MSPSKAFEAFIIPREKTGPRRKMGDFLCLSGLQQEEMWDRQKREIQGHRSVGRQGEVWKSWLPWAQQRQSLPETEGKGRQGPRAGQEAPSLSRQGRAGQGAGGEGAPAATSKGLSTPPPGHSSPPLSPANMQQAPLPLGSGRDSGPSRLPLPSKPT